MDVSPQRVQQWAKAGKLAMNPDGTVNFIGSKVLIEVLSGANERLGIFVGARAEARERREEYEAEMARISLEERKGRLVEAASVSTAAATAGLVIRSYIESMPDQLGPRFAALGGDEERCRALLIDWLDGFVSVCAAAFAECAETARKQRPRN
jgi:hypothetical protein